MMKINTVITILFLLVSLFTGNLVQAANITVQTSRNPVSLDDSFHLVYEADSTVDDEPDFGPVYKNFDVLSSAQSTNMRSINGSWSLKKSWDLTVIAKDVGKFTIPPVKFGRDISPAIQVTVTSSSSSNSTSPSGQASVPAKIFLESQLDRKSGYVQSQFIYTARLLRTVNIASASMTEPTSNDPDAIIKQISEDRYTTTRRGISYQVYERRYAIFPQKSGKLVVNPVTFEGRINAIQPRTIFDQFRMSGQLKRLRSKSVEANVKAAPASVNLQDWLPARNIELLEEWSDDINSIKAGEPVTRTITISAEGLTAVQLPDITFKDIANLKQYPDKPVTENEADSNGITGTRQIKIAIIPSIAGDYTLPEIQLQWWNTKTNRAEVATLPAVTLTANGAASNTSPSPAIPATGPDKAPFTADQSVTPSTGEGNEPSMNTSQTLKLVKEEGPLWKWLTICFALAWLFTLFMCFRKKATPETAPPQHKTPATASRGEINAAADQVKKHAAKNDAGKTRDALIAWARLFYNKPAITNISQIGATCSGTLATEIRSLNEALYSAEHHTWQGNSLLSAFINETENIHNQTTENAALKPLYEN